MHLSPRPLPALGMALLVLMEDIRGDIGPLWFCAIIQLSDNLTRSYFNQVKQFLFDAPQCGFHNCIFLILMVSHQEQHIYKSDFDKGHGIFLQKSKKIYLNMLRILKVSISMKEQDLSHIQQVSRSSNGKKVKVNLSPTRQKNDNKKRIFPGSAKTEAVAFVLIYRFSKIKDGLGDLCSRAMEPSWPQLSWGRGEPRGTSGNATH